MEKSKLISPELDPGKASSRNRSIVLGREKRKARVIRVQFFLEVSLDFIYKLSPYHSYRDLIPNKLLCELVPYCPPLTTLVFGINTGNNSEAAQNILKLSPELENVNFTSSSCSLLRLSLDSIITEKLTIIDLSLQDDDFNIILSNYIKLLQRNPALNQISIRDAKLASTTENNNDRRELLKAICNLRQLETISFDKFGFFQSLLDAGDTSEDIMSLLSRKNEPTFSFSDLFAVEEKDISKNGMIFLQRALISLDALIQHLSKEKNRRAKLDKLKRFFAMCPYVANLHFSLDYPTVSAAMLEEFSKTKVKSGKNLKLELNNNIKSCKVSCAAIEALSPQLQSLYIDVGYYVYTSIGLEANETVATTLSKLCSESCPRLESFSLICCARDLVEVDKYLKACGENKYFKNVTLDFKVYKAKAIPAPQIIMGYYSKIYYGKKLKLKLYLSWDIEGEALPEHVRQYLNGLAQELGNLANSGLQFDLGAKFSEERDIKSDFFKFNDDPFLYYTSLNLGFCFSIKDKLNTLEFYSLIGNAMQQPLFNLWFFLPSSNTYAANDAMLHYFSTARLRRIALSPFAFESGMKGELKKLLKSSPHVIECRARYSGEEPKFFGWHALANDY